jgi:lysozyme
MVQNRDYLIKLLKLHEGIRLKPYRDTVGKLTIGIGRNLSDVGVSQEEALYLLDNDIRNAVSALGTAFSWFEHLDDVRRIVLVDMCFNMGINTLKTFVNTLLNIRYGRYEEAAQNMLKSKWASQVGQRAVRLAEMMRTGTLPELP